MHKWLEWYKQKKPNSKHTGHSSSHKGYFSSNWKNNKGNKDNNSENNSENSKDCKHSNKDDNKNNKHNSKGIKHNYKDNKHNYKDSSLIRIIEGDNLVIILVTNCFFPALMTSLGSTNRKIISRSWITIKEVILDRTGGIEIWVLTKEEIITVGWKTTIGKNKMFRRKKRIYQIMDWVKVKFKD